VRAAHYFRAMQVQVAVICDAATESYGKLNLLGAFDVIYAQQFPWTTPPYAVALRMTFNPADEGSRKLRINLVDEDGKLAMPSMDLAVEVKIPEESHFVNYNFIIVQPLTFERAGHYSVDIAFDGRQEASIPLMVKLLSRPAV
jgi:hypothetical protein